MDSPGSHFGKYLLRDVHRDMARLFQTCRHLLDLIGIGASSDGYIPCAK